MRQLATTYDCGSKRCTQKKRSRTSKQSRAPKNRVVNEKARQMRIQIEDKHVKKQTQLNREESIKSERN